MNSNPIELEENQTPGSAADSGPSASDRTESATVSNTENADLEASGWHGDTIHALKGICMGVCDAVPGVSGGTVALITGIYDRLFLAISHIDRRLFGFLRRGEWKLAARHLDLRFLVALVLGLGLGYVAMSFVIKFVMADDAWRALTLASFAGMVLGSIVVVWKKIQPGNKETIACVVSGLAGCAVSAVIAMQNTAATTGEIGLAYLFACTVIAICAMILPGISGAMLLLIFGVYYSVLEIPRNLIHGEDIGVNLVRMGVVLAGCVTGLLSFGRVIKWLLQTYRAPTLSAMLGLMIGSLIVLWPFQHRIEPVMEHRKPTYEHFLPTEFSWVIPATVVCGLLFAGLVIAADMMTTRIAEARLARIASRSSAGGPAG